MMRSLPLMFACWLPLVCVAQENRDRELEVLTTSFREQSDALESVQLAHYADQLEKLRLASVAKNETAAADQAAAEFATVTKRLLTLTSAPPPKLPPGLPAPTSVQKDADARMEDIFKSGAGEKPKRVVLDGKRPLELRPVNSLRLPEAKTNRQLWASPNASAKWTIDDLPPGKYRVALKYRAMQGESGGTGDLEITGFATPISFVIKPANPAWKQVDTLDIALIDLEKCPVNLTIRSTGRSTANGPLLDLLSVIITPENLQPNRRSSKPENGESAPPKPPEDNRRKVDF